MAKQDKTFITPYNFDVSKDLLPDPSGDEILTIPGQAMTIKEVEARYTRGVPIPIPPASYDDIIGADVDSMDKVELYVYRRQLAQKIDEVIKQKQLTEEEKQKKEVDDIKAELEALKAYKAQQENQVTPKTKGSVADDSIELT